MVGPVNYLGGRSRCRARSRVFGSVVSAPAEGLLSGGVGFWTPRVPSG